MKQQAAIAVLAALVLTGCFSQSKSAASAATSSAVNGTASSGTATASRNSQDWSNTVAKPVTDPAMNMTAFTIRVPAGWKFTGMVERIGGCHGTQFPAQGLTFTALAPDGVTAIEKMPSTTWGWASDGTSGLGPKCDAVKISTAAEYLLNIAIPNMRPDAKNITIVPQTQQQKNGLANLNQQIQANSPRGMKKTVDAARVRLQYNLKGRPVEEVFFAMIQCSEADMPAYPLLHRAAMERHSCVSLGITIKRAPLGKLDALIDKQLPQPEINKEWDNRISQQMQQQFSAWQKQNDEQFQAIQNHFKEVNNQMRENHEAFMAQQKSSFDNAMAQDRATQAATDHAAQMQVRDSLNRQDFIDPNTGRKIETSNQYSHNWISSDGQSVVLNSDPTLDPNGLVDPVRQSWTELIPVN